MGPGDLHEILTGLPKAWGDKNILVGLDPGDDAAVYKIDEDRALVSTVDIITPIVDDAHTWGAIAAINSLSDIWAMGARPLFALSILALPAKLPHAVGAAILAGAAEVCAKAGCPILGGHSIKDEEPKFGLSVVGEVHPQEILTLGGARAGDRLILSKPLGTAAIATAAKKSRLEEDSPSLLRAIESMLSPNQFGERAHSLGVRSMTDITGFGLAGHLLEMLEASGLHARLDSVSIPSLPGARTLLAEGMVCGGGRANEKSHAPKISYGAISPDLRELLHDPQTSGPLLFAVPLGKSLRLLEALRDAGHTESCEIGELLTPGIGEPLKIV